MTDKKLMKEFEEFIGKPKSNLRLFYEALEKHDWYFAFSDDGRVYSYGLAQENSLTEWSTQSPEHKSLFEAFEAHMFSCTTFGKPEVSKPERPKE